MHYSYILFNLFSFLLHQTSAVKDDYNLLQFHNYYRQQLKDCKVPQQPTPITMPDLKWDDELADLARKHGAKCTEQRSQKNERKTKKWTYYGQNIKGTHNVSSIYKIPSDFFAGIKFYDYEKGKCSTFNCYQYLQMIWSKTTHMGCAVTDCRKKKNFPFKYMVVCNYGPGGNIRVEKPYEIDSYNEDRCFQPLVEEVIAASVYQRSAIKFGNTLLELHNDFRQQLIDCKVPGQPGPQTMPMLEWDEGLAVSAKTYSEKCVYELENAKDRRTTKWEYVGQTVAGTYDLSRVPDLFIQGSESYDYGSSKCYDLHCGHYTQMIWSKTTHMGCAVTDCRKEKGFPFKYMVVCNYGPGGNIRGENPYEITNNCGK